MKVLQLTALALLWITGSVSAACAQSQESPPPPREQEPPPPPPEPPFGEEPRENMKRLEVEIRDLEEALRRDDVPEERRAELKKRLMGKKEQLARMQTETKQRRWFEDTRPQDALAALEKRIHDLQLALEQREMGPDERRKVTRMLEEARAQMEETRIRIKQDPRHGQQPPMDPELHKMHQEAQELDKEIMRAAIDLRKTPKEEKGRRDEVFGIMKERVTKLFDVRERIRAREIEGIKKRLEELTQLLEKRKTNRDAIIERRLKQLTGEADELDW